MSMSEGKGEIHAQNSQESNQQQAYQGTSHIELWQNTKDADHRSVLTDNARLECYKRLSEPAACSGFFTDIYW